MNNTQITAFLIVILTFVLSVAVYPQMPDQLASHWNAEGHVDGYMSKFWGLFLLPFISILMLALFLIIPKIDPLKKNIISFRKYYDQFMIILTAFMLYIHILIIFWNLGHVFNMARMIAPSMGFLFYFIGILVQNSKRNWFIGIRTPWTLSSEKVWNSTHKKGGKLFRIAGIIAFFGFIFPNQAIYLIIFPTLFVAIYTIIFSYYEYKRLNK